MDFYGIGSALKTALEIYLNNARGTGRTTNLVRALHDGDIVVCASHGDAAELERGYRSAGKKATCIVASSLYEAAGKLQGMKRQGRLHLSHMLVEHIHTKALLETSQELANFQDQFSFKPREQGNHEL